MYHGKLVTYTRCGHNHSFTKYFLDIKCAVKPAEHPAPAAAEQASFDGSDGVAAVSPSVTDENNNNNKAESEEMNID
jgi:hypothetical protein